MLFSELKENITIIHFNMKKVHQYYTRVVTIGYDDIHFYYIDEQDTTIEEFFMTLDRCFNHAVRRQHRLFKKVESFQTKSGIKLIFGLN